MSPQAVTSSSFREVPLAASVRVQSEIREAPSRIFEVLRSIGPGIVVTGSVIGAGELINTPQRASTFGFAILWAVILSCVIKYWLQVELGRYCVATNLTTIQALNTLPGPRWRNTHIIPLLYMFGFILSMATLAGILTATAGLLRSVCLDLFPNVTVLAGMRFWIVIITSATALLLYRGTYESLERFITLLVAGFSLSVILCLVLIQLSPQRIALADLGSGLTFRVPPGGEYYIISLMGALGTGANELFMYPYWILESGYAKFVGPKESPVATESWYGRARGWLRVMKVDVAVATAIATIVTMGYYLVGAAVLFGAEIGGTDVVKDVSRMFTQTFGRWSYLVFMLGGFCTLYSTLVVMAAATGRMGADLTSSLGFIDWHDEPARRRAIRIFTMTMLTGWLLLSLVMTQPQNYIAFGQFAIGIINTPILLIGIVMMAFRTEKRLRMRKAGTVLLVLSAAVFILVLVRTAPETLAKIGEVFSGLANR
jgi:Mn2+/Fe2+ NRAMP family transporter